MSDKAAIARVPRNFWLTVSILLPLFICAYWVPISATVKVWYTNGDYSYGFLIPIISAYIFWDMRKKIEHVTFQNSWGVFPVLLFFVAISVYAILGSSGNVSRPLVPVLLILFAAYCLGTDFVKNFLLPLSFLIFMVPLPAFLDRTIGVFLKHVSSHLGGQLLRLFGMSVFVSGNVIDLGITKLQVVDACSGLRFLFPLIALGVLYAYFFERVHWKQVVCVLSTVPIAILTNVIRIAITGVLTYKYGSEMAEGFFHGFSGWVIFMVAFAFLFLEGRILRFFPSGYKENPGEKRQVESTENQATWVGDNRALWVSAAVLLTVGVLTLNTKALPPVKIKGGIASFPLTFDGWKGQEQIVDPEIVKKSGAEESFSAVYFGNKGEKVSLYIGYRSTAFLENENFFHSPTVCLPASGWKELKVTTHEISGVHKFGNLKVTKMLVENFGVKNLVYFWFQTKDKATYDKNINRFHLAMHAIKKDNTYDLFIRVITPLRGSDTVTSAEKRLDGFVRELEKELDSFLLANAHEASS